MALPCSARQSALPRWRQVEEHLHLALLVPDDDDLVLADIIDEIVARIRNMAFVAHEVPGARENVVHLQIAKRLVGEDLPVQRSALRIEAGPDFGLVWNTPRLLHQIHGILLLPISALRLAPAAVRRGKDAGSGAETRNHPVHKN